MKLSQQSQTFDTATIVSHLLPLIRATRTVEILRTTHNKLCQWTVRHRNQQLLQRLSHRANNLHRAALPAASRPELCHWPARHMGQFFQRLAHQAAYLRIILPTTTSLLVSCLSKQLLDLRSNSVQPIEKLVVIGQEETAECSQAHC
jgi:hypothetical protein